MFKTLFGRVESKEEAVKIIYHISRVFLILGILQIIGSFRFVDFPDKNRIAIGIIGLIYIGLGILLKKFKSSIIAIILLIFSLIEIFGTTVNWFVENQPKTIPIIAVALAIATIRAIQATLKIQ